MNGRNVGLPRYYRKKLEIDSDALHLKSLEAEAKLRSNYSKLDDFDYMLRLWQSRSQKDKVLKAQQNVRKRGL